MLLFHTGKIWINDGVHTDVQYIFSLIFLEPLSI